MKKKEYQYFIIFGCIVLIVALFFLCSDVLFGSKTDWLGQHTTFPNYFRNLFYETKQLFPDFAPNFGGGQNIFYFSYYGLFSPIVLFSYILPWISMRNYMMIVSLLGIFLSMVLLYFFLRNKVKKETAFLCSLLYFLAGPVLFHAHRHLMFVNYMPFLLLALLGVDRYFEKRKPIMMIASIFLMILTSYYYSIGGIFTIVIYGIYCYLKKNKFQIKTFLKVGIPFLIPILLGILLSLFFLLPTAYCLLSGRGEGSISVSFLSLFLPSFQIKDILYSTYSIGLTGIFMLSLFNLIGNKKCQKRYLGIILFCICFLPITSYLLNGMLYVRTKVLIPFLPLALLAIGLFIDDIRQTKSFSKIFWILLIIFQIFYLLTQPLNLFYIVDIIVTIITILLFQKTSKSWILLISLLIIPLISFTIMNGNEGYVKKTYSDIKIQNLMNQVEGQYTRTSIQSDTLYAINQVYGENHYRTSLYSSLSNANYSEFYKQVFENALPYRNKLILASTDNLLYQTFMGEEYVIGPIKDRIHYDLLSKTGDIGLYQNKSAFPIGYGTSQTISESTWKRLSYPYNIEALLQAVVAKEDTTTVTSHLEEITLTGEPNIGSNLSIQKGDSNIIIEASEKDTISYVLETPLQGKILLIDFLVSNEPSCQDGDITITIAGISNKLTCSSWQYKNENHRFAYVISEKDLSTLEMTFSKGHFEIEDINIYSLDASSISNNHIHPFVIDSIKSKGDTIKGSINMKESGYFTMSIPYEEGFTILVDGKKTSYENVNVAFIGFPLEQGNHTIEIEYHAPYFKEGMLISLVSLFGVCVYLIIFKKCIDTNKCS